MQQKNTEILQQMKKNDIREKNDIISGIDPYSVVNLSTDWNGLPNITNPYFVNNLLFCIIKMLSWFITRNLSKQFV